MPSSDVTVTAAFKEDTPVEVSYAIHVPEIKNGTIEIPETAVENSTVQLIVKPAKGYVVANVVIHTLDGQAVSIADQGNGVYTFTMPASDITVNATFRPESGTETTYKVTIQDSRNGKVTVPQTSYTVGSKVILTAVPDKGYKLDKITAVDSKNQTIKLKKQKDGTYTFEMPANDVTIKASFKTTGRSAVPDSKPNKPGTPPKTGDNSHLTLWSSLVLLSLGSVITFTFYRKRKHK